MVIKPNKRIHVLHPITRLIVGGAQENTMYTAALLDKEKFSVEILSGPQTGSEGSLIEEVKNRGITLTIIHELLRQLSPINDMIAFLKIFRQIKQKEYLIVHTHSSKAGIIGRFAARLAKTPIIIHTVHGWSFHDHMPRFIRRSYILLERITATFTNKLIVVNQEDIKKGLREQIGKPEQYILIRSAIPIEEFNKKNSERDAIRKTLGLPINAPVLGNIGRFSIQKNPLDWIRIAGMVAAEIPNSYFIMVGDGPLKEQAIEMIENTGLKDRMILTGLRRDVANMLSVIDVFLLTSLWEGLPRVIPQAMMMEIPVVAYHVDGLKDIIINTKNGYLCNPGDIHSATKYCVKLLSEPKLRQEMGAFGRTMVEEDFDLRKMISQIEHIYLELITEKRYG
jgi:glycosyltransferase involved in cell wall biosynthesis